MSANMTPESRAVCLKGLSAKDLQGESSVLLPREPLSRFVLSNGIYAAFREICTSHELSERDVVEQDVPVVNVEMFLFNFPKVSVSAAAPLHGSAKVGACTLLLIATGLLHAYVPLSTHPDDFTAGNFVSTPEQLLD